MNIQTIIRLAQESGKMILEAQGVPLEKQDFSKGTRLILISYERGLLLDMEEVQTVKESTKAMVYMVLIGKGVQTQKPLLIKMYDEMQEDKFQREMERTRKLVARVFRLIQISIDKKEISMEIDREISHYMEGITYLFPLFDTVYLSMLDSVKDMKDFSDYLKSVYSHLEAITNL